MNPVVQGGDDGSTLRSAYYVSHKGQTAENSNRYKDLLEALKVTPSPFPPPFRRESHHLISLKVIQKILTSLQFALACAEEAACAEDDCAMLNVPLNIYDLE
jgi:hypothetical protein